MILFVGFACYSVDPVNAGVALLGAQIPPTSTPVTVTVAGVKFIFSGMTYEMFGLNPASGQGRWKLQVMFGVAALLLAAAAMMRTWATAYLDTDVVQDAKLHSDKLVADGPYRHVRNPLYFANVLMTLSMALLASRVGFLAIAAGMIVFQYRLIGREEEELARAQGQGYRNYCKAVPRLWPSLQARVPAGNLRPRWKQAWLTEAFFFWGMTVAVASFAVTLNIGYAYGLFALSIVCYIILWMVRSLRTKRDHGVH
ncbi:MAG TPA: isoprenylcysteine carboxylmethyltransferase family protein [Bryobacteraceae bacterium]|nr:isoprenylcysteine carboxylmethyltransferase family protein [Bryobacteraceae bacterium]